MVRGFIPVALPLMGKLLAKLRAVFGDWRVALSAVGLIGIVGGLVYGLVLLLGLLGDLLSQRFPRANAWLQIYGLQYIVTAVLTIVLLGLARYGVFYFIDRRRAKNFMTTARGSCKLSHLVTVLERLRLSASRGWLLREVRRGNALEPEPTVEAELKSLIASYEGTVAPPTKLWDGEAIDELSMLLEQVPTRRASTQIAGSSG